MNLSTLKATKNPRREVADELNLRSNGALLDWYDRSAGRAVATLTMEDATGPIGKIIIDANGWRRRIDVLLPGNDSPSRDLGSVSEGCAIDLEFDGTPEIGRKGFKDNFADIEGLHRFENTVLISISQGAGSWVQVGRFVRFLIDGALVRAITFDTSEAIWQDEDHT